jgi:hypothetical protein
MRFSSMHRAFLSSKLTRVESQSVHLTILLVTSYHFQFNLLIPKYRFSQSAAFIIEVQESLNQHGVACSTENDVELLVVVIGIFFLERQHPRPTTTPHNHHTDDGTLSFAILNRFSDRKSDQRRLCIDYYYHSRDQQLAIQSAPSSDSVR